MTPEIFVLVVLGLVVKYTLEFADRRRWREKRRRRRRAWNSRPATRPHPRAPVTGRSEDAAPVDIQAQTGDPFWDMVSARIAALPEDDRAGR